MTGYTQTGRPLKITTKLGDDVLLLTGFSGEEHVSRPYAFDLELVSEEDAIDASTVLRTPATVTLETSDGEERSIHGVIRRFVQLGQAEGGELTSYRAELVPWLWFLSISSDCKIFQNLSVLEIVEQVFQQQGYRDFDIRCINSYDPREYCVQYRESHLNFVSRLLEEEGVYYYFEHTESKHVMVLADRPDSLKPCPGQSTGRVVSDPGAWRDEDVITSLHSEYSVHTGKITLRDYDPLQPSLRLESSVTDTQPEEEYDYPGGYTDLGAGDRQARVRLEEREARGHVLHGEGTMRSFQSGCLFDLAEHYRRDLNTTYQLLRVKHTGHGGGFRSDDDGTFEYHNDFTAIPSTVPFRPVRRGRKPVVEGAQTAVVVGPPGEEIFVDSHGRVKVQFHWDRDGKKDDKSSCWVRVSSTWAGKNWGFVQIPRIGQEVIVDFLEGDPDLPIITGRVYNAEQVPPYSLPANKTQSGVKSRSSAGAGPENFNEIRMEDKTGSEQLYIHAEKDKQVVVENDRSESVGHDETIEIGNDRTETVGNDEKITVGNDRTEQVGNDESIAITGHRTESVGKNETVDISDNRKTTVGKDESVDVRGNRTVKIAKNDSTRVGDDRSADVGKSDSLKVGKKLVIDAGDEILIKTGKAKIVMKKDGTIQIEGKDITIKGSGGITVKASKNVVMKGKKIQQN